MLDGGLDRTAPDEAEVAVARPDRDLRDIRPGLDAGAMHVQLLLAETIGPAAGRLLDELGAKDVFVKAFDRSQSETAITKWSSCIAVTVSFEKRRSPKGDSERALSLEATRQPWHAAHMQETTKQRSVTLAATDELVAAAKRAEKWAGEPSFTTAKSRPGACTRDGPAPGARRGPGRDRGRPQDAFPEWKVRFALMLGLERVLSEKPPKPLPAPNCAAIRSTRWRGCSPS